MSELKDLMIRMNYHKDSEYFFPMPYAWYLKKYIQKNCKWPFPSIRKFPSCLLWLYSKSWLMLHWLLSNGYVDTPQGSLSLHSGSWYKWESYVLQFQTNVWCREELLVSRLTKVKRVSSMHQLFDCHNVPIR